MEKIFSIRESLRFGWNTLKSQSRLIFQILLTVLAVQVAYSIVTTVLHNGLGFVAAVVLFLAELVLSVGSTVVTLKFAKGERAEYGDILPSMNLVLRFVAASLLTLCIVAIPLVIAFAFSVIAYALNPQIGIFVGVVCGAIGVVASAYFALRYFLVRYAIVDGAGITESLRISAKATKERKWQVLGFLLVAGAVNILGALCLLVGLLVTIPVTFIAYAFVYTKLRHSLK